MTDVANVDYVADPFIVQEGSTYYMFYEVHQTTVASVICYSTSANGLAWTYGAKVLDSLIGGASKLSYPYVFRASGVWYMIPDHDNRQVKLYRATNFPTTWEAVEILLDTGSYTVADVTPIQWGGNWYLFVGDFTNTQLRLFYNSKLFGQAWTEHPSSPLYAADGLRNTRPGGRPVLRAATIDLFLQDSVIRYGEKVRKYTITDLSPTTYTAAEAAESPLLQSTGAGWNAQGLHQLDRASATLSAVDGQNGGIWSIGIYRDVP